MEILEEFYIDESLLKEEKKELTDEAFSFLTKYIKYADNDKTGEAAYTLAFVYFDNIFIKQDLNKFIYYLENAHGKNFVLATEALSVLYYFGYGTEKDPEKSNSYTYLLANNTDNEIGFGEDLDKCPLYNLIKRAGHLDDLKAADLISDFYYNSCIESNSIPELWERGKPFEYYLKSIDWLSYAHESGDKSANYKIYKLMDELDYADEDNEFLYLTLAAKQDKYAPAIKEYKKFIDEGWLTGEEYDTYING